MNSENFGKQGLVTLSIIIIVLIVVIWMVCPRNLEMFDGNNADNAVLSGKNTNGVSIDAQTSAMMNGPGFEQSVIDGVNGMGDVVASEGNFTSNAIPSNYYYLDDGNNGETTIMNNLFSPSCCAGQWPTPFNQKANPYVCQNKSKFVPSNYFGNNTFNDSGCLCATTDQMKQMYNRYGNGREWF